MATSKREFQRIATERAVAVVVIVGITTKDQFHGISRKEKTIQWI